MSDSDSDMKIYKLDLATSSDDCDDLVCDPVPNSTPSVSKPNFRFRKPNTTGSNNFHKYSTNTFKNNSLTNNPLEHISPAPSFDKSAIENKKAVHEQARTIIRLIEEAKFEGKTRCYFPTNNRLEIYPENRQCLIDNGYEICEEQTYHDIYKVDDPTQNNRTSNTKVYIDWSNEPNIGESPLESLKLFKSQFEKIEKLNAEALKIKKAIEKAQLNYENSCNVNFSHEIDDSNIKTLVSRGYRIKKPNGCLEKIPPIYPYTIEWNHSNKFNPLVQLTDRTTKMYQSNDHLNKIKSQAQEIVNTVKKALQNGYSSCTVGLQERMYKQNEDVLFEKNYEVTQSHFFITTGYATYYTYIIKWNTVSSIDSQSDNIIKNGIPNSPVESREEVKFPKTTSKINPIGTGRPRRLIPENSPFEGTSFMNDRSPGPFQFNERRYDPFQSSTNFLQENSDLFKFRF